MTGGWRFELTTRAVRDLRRIDLPNRQQIIEALERLAGDPFQGDIRKLQGAENEWRLRVGDWRVRYERDDESRTIWVLQVSSRASAYRRETVSVAPPRLAKRSPTADVGLGRARMRRIAWPR